MATTDINGMVFYTATDPVEPLQTVLNAMSTATTNALNAQDRVFKVADATARNALYAARGAPLTVARLDNGALERNIGTGWTAVIQGASWTSYTPSVVSGLTIGNGTLSAAYTRIDRTVHFRLWFIWGTTTAVTSGAFSFSLPLACSSATSIIGVSRVIDTSSANSWCGITIPDGASGSPPTRAVAQVPATTAVSNLTFVQPGVPFAWANGDVFSITGTYEMG